MGYHLDAQEKKEKKIRLEIGMKKIKQLMETAFYVLEPAVIANFIIISVK